MNGVVLDDKITVELFEQCGEDGHFISAMKASTGSPELNELSDDIKYKKINFLMKFRHGSVFEHGLLSCVIDAPIFVIREWQRHRHLSFNEESGRYSVLRNKFWIPSKDRLMKRTKEWKPSRPRDEMLSLSDEEYNAIIKELEHFYSKAWQQYSNLLSKGIVPEVSRSVLPVSVFSRCLITGNPRAWMHFFSLRIYSEKAKYASYPMIEIENAALQCERLFKQFWPVTFKCFEENGRVSP